MFSKLEGLEVEEVVMKLLQKNGKIKENTIFNSSEIKKIQGYEIVSGDKKHFRDDIIVLEDGKVKIFDVETTLDLIKNFNDKYILSINLFKFFDNVFLWPVGFLQNFYEKNKDLYFPEIKETINSIEFGEKITFRFIIGYLWKSRVEIGLDEKNLENFKVLFLNFFQFYKHFLKENNIKIEKNVLCVNKIKKIYNKVEFLPLKISLNLLKEFKIENQIFKDEKFPNTPYLRQTNSKNSFILFEKMKKRMFEIKLKEEEKEEIKNLEQKIKNKIKIENKNKNLEQKIKIKTLKRKIIGDEKNNLKGFINL